MVKSLLRIILYTVINCIVISIGVMAVLIGVIGVGYLKGDVGDGTGISVIIYLGFGTIAALSLIPIYLIGSYKLLRTLAKNSCGKFKLVNECVFK